MITLKKDQFSEVWRDERWVYKRQHEFLTDNEYWFLVQMYPSGFVPAVEKLDRDLIRTRYIHHAPKGKDYQIQYVDRILEALALVGIRHGDLTKYAIRAPLGGRPMLIDFSESRLWDDPRPDKRPEGDRYWLTKTMQEYVNGTS